MQSIEIQIIGLVLTALGICWSIWIWIDGRKRKRQKREVPYLMEDAEGQPQPEIVVVGPGGHFLSPDGRGMVLVPYSWLGKRLQIRHAKTGRRITSFQPPDDDNSDEPRTFTIPED